MTVLPPGRLPAGSATQFSHSVSSATFDETTRGAGHTTTRSIEPKTLASAVLVAVIVTVPRRCALSLLPRRAQEPNRFWSSAVSTSRTTLPS